MFITSIYHTRVSRLREELLQKQNDIIANKKEKSIIPLNIFQTWYTLDLPSDMKACVDTLKLKNPEFTHYLYDDAMMRDFIKTHFDEDVLYALDKLKPGAFKADLWRYCVLYIHGGIYLDIKYKCINGFRLIALTDREYWVRDRFNGVYQALMVNLPGNPALLQAIKQIVKNIKEEYYGKSSLAVTGPQLLKEFISQYEIKKSNLSKSTFCGLYINYKHIHILKIYDNYRSEQNKTTKIKHYGALWKNRDIYNIK